MRTGYRVGAAVTGLVLVAGGAVAASRVLTADVDPANTSDVTMGPAAALEQPLGSGSPTSSPSSSARSALRWSDPATWDGKLPGAGQAVTIPAGRSIVLDVSPPSLSRLTVKGTLTFAETDLELRAKEIVVSGALRVGTAQEPFRSRARIVLTGKKVRDNGAGTGTKVLAVQDGTLDLHGENRPGWTRLGATTDPGATRLTLDKTMPWRRGDRIVVASTDFDSAQAERFTVAGVDGRTLTLDSPVRHQHWGTLQTIAGRTLDERAEVALLSRNVSVEGEDDTSRDGFGAHVMVTGGAARIAGAEFRKVGQLGSLGRYPVHFHVHGDASGSYVKNSSIHSTFNRCLTIHGTQNLTVSGNVCADHIGHGYFLEDGIETGNVLTGNLGLSTRRPAEGRAVLPSDAKTPATFWITNPANTIRDNVAAGSEGHGFWIALPEHPTGLSRTTKVWPQRTPLGEFRGNTAHSNHRNGLHVDDGPTPDGTTENASYRPRTSPAKDKSQPVVARYRDFTAYKNRDEGAWLRGSHQRMEGAVLADNAIGVTFAADDSGLVDSFVVGESANRGKPGRHEAAGAGGRSLPKPYRRDFPIRGFEFYDGPVSVEATTFANFTPNEYREASALGFKLDNAFPMSPLSSAKALRFVDANRVHAHDPAQGRNGDRSSTFRDLDGSVTGTPGRVVAAAVPFLHDASCTRRDEWNASVCATSLVTVGVDAKGNSAAVSPLILRRGDGTEQSLRPPDPGEDEVTSAVLRNAAYEVGFAGGEAPTHSEYVLRGKQGTWVELVIPFVEAPKVTKYGCDIDDPDKWCYGGRPGSREALLRASASSYYYDAATKRLHLRLLSKDYEALEVRKR